MADKLSAYGIDPSVGETDVAFHWGNVMRESTDDNFFHVRNESDEYLAKGVTVSAEDFTGSPGLGNQILFSLDRWTYTDVVSIGDIPPFGVSPLITIRRVTRPDAVSGTYTIVLKAASWAIQETDVTAETVIEESA